LTGSLKEPGPARSGQAVVQKFLDEVIKELGKGNRLEFRDFGVFETKIRKARRAQNPKTLAPWMCPRNVQSNSRSDA